MKKKENKPSGYEKVITKSKAGVEYIKYIPIKIKLPHGFNREDRLRLDAMNKRIEGGRNYYLIRGNTRIYIKNEQKA